MNKEDLEFEIEKQLDLLRELSDDNGEGIKERMDELDLVVENGFDLAAELEDEDDDE